ncbi:MAG: metal-dependent hydrolase [Acidobacteria bacterium]|nr:metal-dependent hydrolase [Acidobacteriota bacterium]
MDNLCHTLVGAACGEAGLKRRTRYGAAALMVAANLPDVDVLVLATEAPAVAFRRGWTHGPLAQALLPVVLTGVLMAVDRLRRPRGDTPAFDARWTLLLGYIGVLSHVALDLLNPYGLRLFAPFDWRWLYGDVLFILDPWLWLILGGGVWFARRRRGPLLAQHALALAVVYILSMTLNARAARAVVLDEWRRTRGGNPVALMVGPVPVTPFRKQVVIDSGLGYETGTFEWFPTRLTLDPAVVPENDDDPRVARARRAPNVRGFLAWARFPYWTLEPVPGGTRVTVGDMRFTGQTPARFNASTVVPEAPHSR